MSTANPRASVTSTDASIALSPGKKSAIVMIVALIAGLLTAFLPTQLAPASAASNPATTSALGTNAFFIYAEAGDGVTARFTTTESVNAGQNYRLLDPSGEVVWTCEIPANAATGTTCEVPAPFTGQTGVWTLDTSGTGIPPSNWPQSLGIKTDWTINAVSLDDSENGTPISGRVWTKQHRAYSANVGDLGFWVVSENGAQYKVELPGFNGIGWSFNSDAFGNVTEPNGCTPAYRSFVNTINTPEHQGPGAQCGEGYNLFFEQPAADLPSTAPSAEGDLFVLPTYTAPTVTDVAYTATSPLTRAGSLTYDINSFTGNYVIRIDTDGDGSYTGPADRTIPQSGTSGEKTYQWNGLDAQGNAVATCTPVSFQVAIERTDEIHFVLGDVETLGGVKVTQLQGSDIGNDLLYWDDTDVPNSGSGPKTSTTPQLTSLDGTSSASGDVHGWAGTGSNQWGNFASIDNWTYSDVNITDETTAPGVCLSVGKVSDATADTRVGDEVTYSVSVTNNGTDDYTEQNPAVVSDDLSGVLDDATFDLADVTATDESGTEVGEATFTSPKLSWSGPIGAGETVQIDYTVTVTGAGDRVARNIAYVGTPDQTTPVCNPPTEGVDPETGIPCATTSFELPRLQISKDADRDEVPAAGEEVTYTVTVTNPSGTAYSAAAPASMTDDLSDVLDDATLVDGSLQASTGSASIEGTTVSWSGALAAGGSATITYTVVYTGAGDTFLRNTACLPAGEVLAGDAQCDSVDVPGSGLTQWKTSTPSTTPLAAGSTITYTLHFQNDGEAAATVDAIDDLTHVSDDAAVTVEPTSTDGLGIVRNGDRIAITGSVPAGSTYTVTYTVTLRADGERGDNIAANYLLAPDGTPPAQPVCTPTDADAPDCTVNVIPEITYAKSVVASDETLVPGTELTYTITVTNSGAATGPVARADNLTGVLDDATLISLPTVAGDGDVTATPVVGGIFSIAGTLGAGETATVTYTVTINAEDQRGDDRAANFLVADRSTTPPAVCEPGSVDCTVTDLPNVTSSKSVDPESGTTVLEGDELTYTLTFTNGGKATGPVDFTDHLANVLDDADVTAEPVASTDAITAVRDDATITIAGSLAAGQTVTVSYTVTVLPDGERGDNTLGNFLVRGDEQPPAACDPENPNCTVNPVPYIVDSKSADPVSGTPVAAGQTVTYTLSFRNDGAAAGEVARDDVLTGVLDDADLVGEPTVAGDGELSAELENDRLLVTGVLDAGASATVSYSVVIRPFAQQGDHVLGNFLVRAGEQPPATCEPVDGETADCTVHPIGEIVATKSVDPASTTAVQQGDVLTYTLTFRNTGAGAATVDYVDRMGDVLDDATLTRSASASVDSIETALSGDVLSIGGSLPAGATATVTYAVTVMAYDRQGNHVLGNFLGLSNQTPTGVCATGSDLCTTNPIQPPAALAVTGGSFGLGALAAAILAVLGGGLLLIMRRREVAAQ